MVRFSCPACEKCLKAPDSVAGKASRCPNCGQRVVVPAFESREELDNGEDIIISSVATKTGNVSYPHSGPGIASFIISMVMLVLGLFSLLLDAVLSSRIHLRRDEDTSSEITAVLFICSIPILSVFAFVLGIGGCCQSRRRKVFAILGLIFSLAPWIVMFCDILIYCAIHPKN